MFTDSKGRIGDDKACSDAEIETIATQATTTTQTAVFQPVSKDELANAIGGCVLEDKD